LFAIALRRPDRSRETPSEVAGLGLVRACVTRRDGTSNLVLQGITRVRLGKAVRYRPYRLHQVRPIPAAPTNNLAVQAMTNKVLELVSQRLESAPGEVVGKTAVDEGESPAGGKPFTAEAFQQALKHLRDLEDAEQLVDLVSATMLRNSRQRQVILETVGLEERLRYLVHFLQAGDLDDSPSEP
jgi:Lon protease-like protein